jgi:hypothetical protein
MREWEVGERERERSVEGRGGEQRRSRRERGRRSGDPGTGGRRRPLFADQPHHGRGVVAWSSTPFGYLQRHINLGSKIVTVYKKSLSFCSVKIEPELANLEHFFHIIQHRCSSLADAALPHPYWGRVSAMEQGRREGKIRPCVGEE